MVDFICKGYLVRKSSENYKMKKFLPTVGFEPGAFRLWSERANTDLQGLMYMFV